MGVQMIVAYRGGRLGGRRLMDRADVQELCNEVHEPLTLLVCVDRGVQSSHRMTVQHSSPGPVTSFQVLNVMWNTVT